MYAIIRSGNKQYSVKAGDYVRVEKLEQELGAEFNLSDVLLVGGDKTFVGAPTVSGAKVVVVVAEHDLDRKKIIFKKKRRKGFRKMRGHRQPFTTLFVKSITNPDGESQKAETKAHVLDPVVQAEKKMARRLAEEAKSEAAEASGETKQVTKRAAPKKSAAGKSGKKKTTKKKAGTKKSAKKSTKK